MHILNLLMLCKVKSSLHVEDERPLVLTIPKPFLVPAKPGSTFGFKPNSATSRSTTGVMTSNYKATNASTESSETVPNPEDDSHQAADMDVDIEDFYVDAGDNVGKGSLGTCSFPIFLHAILTYILRWFRCCRQFWQCHWCERRWRPSW